MNFTLKCLFVASSVAVFGSWICDDGIGIATGQLLVFFQSSRMHVFAKTLHVNERMHLSTLEGDDRKPKRSLQLHGAWGCVGVRLRKHLESLRNGDARTFSARRTGEVLFVAFFCSFSSDLIPHDAVDGDGLTNGQTGGRTGTGRAGGRATAGTTQERERVESRDYIPGILHIRAGQNMTSQVLALLLYSTCSAYLPLSLPACFLVRLRYVCNSDDLLHTPYILHTDPSNADYYLHIQVPYV